MSRPLVEAGVIKSVAAAIESLRDEKAMKDIRPPASAKRGDDAFGLWFRGHERDSYETHAEHPAPTRR